MYLSWRGCETEQTPLYISGKQNDKSFQRKLDGVLPECTCSETTVWWSVVVASRYVEMRRLTPSCQEPSSEALEIQCNSCSVVTGGHSQSAILDQFSMVGPSRGGTNTQYEVGGLRLKQAWQGGEDEGSAISISQQG